MFKWLINLFKKEAPGPFRIERLSEEELRRISEQAVRSVASKKIVTKMIEENRAKREEALKRHPVIRSPSRVQLERTASQNVASRRNDDDDLMLTSSILATQVYSTSYHSSSSHDDGGSYSSGSCDSGSSGGCD